MGLTKASRPARRIVCALVVLLGGGLATAARAQTGRQKRALEGHESFEVQIVGLGDGLTAQKLGIDGKQLLASIEERMQAAGVKVEPISEQGSRALLGIEIRLAYDDATDMAVWSTQASLRQAILDPMGRILEVITWTSGGYVGTANLGRARREIEASVTGQLDEFLEDYQAARRTGRDRARPQPAP